MNAAKSKRGLSGELNATCSVWKLKTREIQFGRLPVLMGIINVTPDSFSDGGQHAGIEGAVDHALRLAKEGAGILDIGGESTRPYSDPVSLDEELARTIPVIEKLVSRTDLPISIDTSKSAVARAAIEAGAEIINDVTGLEGDPQMVDVAAESGAGICMMHMQGTPQTMQDSPQYTDVVAEVFDYLRRRLDTLVAAGIDVQRICLDPGIGFGKSQLHNLELIATASRFHELGRPVLVGHSRKGFIGNAIGDPAANRSAGNLAVTLQLAQQAIQVIRLHEIEPAVQALNVFNATGGIDGQPRMDTNGHESS